MSHVPKSHTPIEELLKWVVLGDGAIELAPHVKTRADKAIKQIESHYQNLYLGRLPKKLEFYGADYELEGESKSTVISYGKELGFNKAVSLMESAIRGKE